MKDNERIGLIKTVVYGLVILLSAVFVIMNTSNSKTQIKRPNYANTLKNTVIINSKDNFGTAFFVSEDLLITNKHVISSDKKEYKAHVNGIDSVFEVTHIMNHPKNDLALIKISGYKSDSKINLCTDYTINLADEVYTIGNVNMRLKKGFINMLTYRDGTNYTSMDIIGGSSGSALMLQNKDCSIGVMTTEMSVESKNKIEHVSSGFVPVDDVIELIELYKKGE